jgi:small subunit ribosomal protein S17
MANNRRRLIGRVVSDKMDKTVVVAIERRKLHRVYKKVITFTKKVMAHDETNEIELGSVVQVVESKPISKNKRWVVEKVLEGPGGRVLEPIVGVVDVTTAGDETAVTDEVEADEPVADEPVVEAEADDDVADEEAAS